MFWKKCIGWKPSVRFIKKDNKVYVANTDNGASQFISRECYDILEESIREKLTFYDLIKLIEDIGSKEYMKSLINKFNRFRMWDYEGDFIDSSYFDISLDITNKCNLRCKHCCISASENSKGTDLNEEKIISIVDKIVSLNPNSIVISGGEPIVRKDFKRIIKRIRNKYSGTLSLMTNATLIDTEISKFINDNFDSVDVSIDGADEDSCSVLRGAGTFAKCISGIKRLKTVGVKKISASMVVVEDNKHAKDAFLKLCKNLGMKPMIRRLDNTGRAKEVYDDIVVKKDVMMNLEREKNNLKKLEDLFIKEKMYLNLPQVFTCQASRVQFQIDYRGNIYPCAALMEEQFNLGNVLSIDNLQEYLEKRLFENTQGYIYFNSLKPYNINRCCDCEYNILCFTCVGEIKRGKSLNTIYDRCSENKFYFDLYWRDYEGI